MPKRTACLLFVILIWPAIVWAQESLQAAQGLYASASYEEALAMLERLQKQPLAPADAVELQQNRALCLLALGRTADAEDALAAVVKTDPTYRPPDTTTAPRVRTMFKEVRSRLLAGLIVSAYGDARTAYDQHQWGDALKRFKQVQALVSDPDLPPGDAKGVQEYKVLANGFAVLAEAAAAPPAEPPTCAGAPAPSALVAPVAPAAPVADSAIFDASNPNVVPPMTLRQDMPRWVLQGPRPRAGALEIVISPDGTVESAAVKQSMSPAFDRLLLDATKNWKYQPAALDGRPVRYRKQIRINFQ